jgi:hypothetical protein
LLQLRAQRRAHATASKFRSFSYTDIAADVARLDIADVCLRPLSEGLALFAEFDVTPRMISTKKVSLPMWWTHHFFSLFGRDVVAKGLFETLSALRSSPEMERRRRGVLADECTGRGGGYLPGYLAVKQVWLMAIQNDARFIDRDLFMMFFKSLIFGDMELVTILLDSEIRADVATKQIVGHVLRRLASLWDLDLQAALNQFVTALHSGGPRIHGPRTVIACDAAVTARAQELLRRHISEIESVPTPTGDISDWDTLCFYDGLTMARRDLMRLGSVGATASIRRGTVLLEAGGEPLLAMPAQPTARLRRSSNVVLDVEISPAFDDMLLSVWQDHRLLGQSIGAPSPDEKNGREARNNSQASIYLGSREDQAKHYDEAQHDLDLICEPKARQNLRADVREEFFDILSEIALGQTPIELRAERWREMAAGGILALLHGDNDKLRILSIVGLMSSISTNRAMVLEGLAKLGITEADVMAVSEAGQAVSVPLVVVQDDLLITVT